MATDASTDSKTQAQHAVIRLASKILRPLIQILLRYELPCDELQEVCRWLYVDEAAKRRERLGGVMASASHLALVTGLSREAVLHYRHYQAPETLVTETPGSRASRVQSRWLADPRYLGADGTALAIPFTASTGPSFSDLVRDYGSDANPRFAERA